MYIGDYMYITLVPEVFLCFSQTKLSHKVATTSGEVARKTSGIKPFDSHFHADTNCQTLHIANTQSNQWQAGFHVLISR